MKKGDTVSIEVTDLIQLLRAGIGKRAAMELTRADLALVMRVQDLIAPVSPDPAEAS